MTTEITTITTDTVPQPLHHQQIITTQTVAYNTSTGTKHHNKHNNDEDNVERIITIKINEDDEDG